MISHARKEAIIFHLKLKALIGEFHGNAAFKMTFFFKVTWDSSPQCNYKLENILHLKDFTFKSLLLSFIVLVKMFLFKWIETDIFEWRTESKVSALKNWKYSLLSFIFLFNMNWCSFSCYLFNFCVELEEELMKVLGINGNSYVLRASYRKGD